VLEEKKCLVGCFGYLMGVKLKRLKLDFLRNYMKVLTSEKLHRGNMQLQNNSSEILFGSLGAEIRIWN